MRSGSVSERRTLSPTNPGCFLSIGSTFSWMALASSCVFPVLAMISTIRVNMAHSFRFGEMGKEPVARARESLRDMGCNAMPRGALCQLRQHLCRPYGVSFAYGDFAFASVTQRSLSGLVGLRLRNGAQPDTPDDLVHPGPFANRVESGVDSQPWQFSLLLLP